MNSLLPAENREFERLESELPRTGTALPKIEPAPANCKHKWKYTHSSPGGSTDYYHCSKCNGNMEEY